MKKIIAISVLVAVLMCLAGCTEAKIVSHNISKSADSFNVLRRLVVLNLRTDEPIFEVIGYFSLQVGNGTNDQPDGTISILVDVGDGIYKKHIIGIAGDVVYVIEDINGSFADPYHYEVNFFPERIIPRFTRERSGANYDD